MLDIPIILLLHKLGLPAYIGTVIATCIGYTISISIVVKYLKKDMNFNFRKSIETFKNILIPAIIMIIPIIVLKHFITFDLNRWTALLSVIVYGLLGTFIYLVITYKNKSLENVFGKEFLDNIFRKLHLKK